MIHKLFCKAEVSYFLWMCEYSHSLASLGKSNLQAQDVLVSSVDKKRALQDITPSVKEYLQLRV